MINSLGSNMDSPISCSIRKNAPRKVVKKKGVKYEGMEMNLNPDLIDFNSNLIVVKDLSKQSRVSLLESKLMMDVESNENDGGADVCKTSSHSQYEVNMSNQALSEHTVIPMSINLGDNS